MKNISILIIQYPGAMKSAIEGLCELFDMATRLSQEQQPGLQFNVQVLESAALNGNELSPFVIATPQVIVLPPCLVGSFYTEEQQGPSRLA